MLKLKIISVLISIMFVLSSIPVASCEDQIRSNVMDLMAKEPLTDLLKDLNKTVNSSMEDIPVNSLYNYVSKRLGENLSLPDYAALSEAINISEDGPGGVECWRFFMAYVADPNKVYTDPNLGINDTPYNLVNVYHVEAYELMIDNVNEVIDKYKVKSVDERIRYLNTKSTDADSVSALYNSTNDTDCLMYMLNQSAPLLEGLNETFNKSGTYYTGHLKEVKKVWRSF